MVEYSTASKFLWWSLFFFFFNFSNQDPNTVQALPLVDKSVSVLLLRFFSLVSQISLSLFFFSFLELNLLEKQGRVSYELSLWILRMRVCPWYFQYLVSESRQVWSDSGSAFPPITSEWGWLLAEDILKNGDLPILPLKGEEFLFIYCF